MNELNAWPQLRVQALESVRVLASLLESETSQRRLIDGYLESKRLLADAYQSLLRQRIAERIGMLDVVKDSIETEMKNAFGDVIPLKYLRVRGYISPHRELFAYLSLFVDKPVPASVLRIITADAVHTERRARELRDLGLQLDAEKTGGADVYVLRSLEPDVTSAAQALVKKNIENDKRLESAHRKELLAVLK